MDKAQIEKHFK